VLIIKGFVKLEKRSTLVGIKPSRLCIKSPMIFHLFQAKKGCLCFEGAHATKKFASSLSRFSSGKIHVPLRSLPPPHLPKKRVLKQRFYAISFIFIRPLLVHAGSYTPPAITDAEVCRGAYRYSPSTLKVPKRENFSLAFFALSEPIWVCDLGTGDKNRIFYQLTPDFDSFWFFAAH
jgi:hypothetical protein